MWLWYKNCMSCLYAKLLVLLKLAPQTSSVQISHPYLLNISCVCWEVFTGYTLEIHKLEYIHIYTISIKYCHNWKYIPHLQIPKTHQTQSPRLWGLQQTERALSEHKVSPQNPTGFVCYVLFNGPKISKFWGIPPTLEQTLLYI